MEVVIIEIKQNSKLLQDIIDLGDRNKDTLGLLPHAAYEEAANQGHILIAVTPNQECVGYLLYRIVKTKRRAAITHLCVDKEFRGNGIGRKLVEYLAYSTHDLLGISLFCKRGYDSHNFWPYIGFQYVGEKLGRGKNRDILTHYWYDHNHPSILTLIDKKKIESKTMEAVIDTNIFVFLFENPDHPLLADWLLEDLALCVTPELYNEINRDDRGNRRREMLRYARSFPKITANETEVQQVFELVRPYFPEQLRIQDKSDIKQIAYTIASGADFFVTRDRRLVEQLGNVLLNDFGLSIVADDDLIIYIDEFLKEVTYQPQRLAGSPIYIKRVSSRQSDFLAEVFHRQTGEKKSIFRAKLSKYLAYPNKYKTLVVTVSKQEPLALIILHQKSSHMVEIPLMRTVEGPLSSSLESEVLSWATEQAVNEGKILVLVTDDNFIARNKQVLEENSFTICKKGGIKINLKGIYSVSEIESFLKKDGTYKETAKPAIDEIKQKLTDAITIGTPQKWIEVEQSLWPAKIANIDIPTFVIPIQPTWAIDLFDYELGKRTLFGSDPSLIFRMENIYYRSANTRLPSAPSRVLWYISKGKLNRSFRVMAVRACSYVEETIIGSPKELFKQFNNLGVYRWQDVLAAARNDPKKNILAFRFSRTELFDNPVPLKEYKKITGRRSPPNSPQSITDEEFIEIYKRGIQSHSGK